MNTAKIFVEKIFMKKMLIIKNKFYKILKCIFNVVTKVIMSFFIYNRSLFSNILEKYRINIKFFYNLVFLVPKIVFDISTNGRLHWS